MTDRVHSLTVVLEQDYRTDDVEPLIDAIAHFRGVLTVQTHVTDVTSMMAEVRAKNDMFNRVIATVKEMPREET